MIAVWNRLPTECVSDSSMEQITTWNILPPECVSDNNVEQITY